MNSRYLCLRIYSPVVPWPILEAGWLSTDGAAPVLSYNYYFRRSISKTHFTLLREAEVMTVAMKQTRKRVLHRMVLMQSSRHRICPNRREFHFHNGLHLTQIKPSLLQQDLRPNATLYWIQLSPLQLCSRFPVLLVPIDRLSQPWPGLREGIQLLCWTGRWNPFYEAVDAVPIQQFFAPKSSWPRLLHQESSILLGISAQNLQSIGYSASIWCADLFVCLSFLWFPKPKSHYRFTTRLSVRHFRSFLVAS